MRQKTPDFLEAVLAPCTMQPLRQGADPPPQKTAPYGPLAGIFSRTEAVLKTKLRPDNVYLSVLLFGRDGRILMTANGLLPTVSIQKGSPDAFEADSEEFGWLLKVAMDWEKPDSGIASEPTKEIAELNAGQGNGKTARSEGTSLAAVSSEPYGFEDVAARGQTVRRDKEKSFRYLFYKAANRIREALDLRVLGFVYRSPVHCVSSNSKMVVAMQYVHEEIMQEVGQYLVKSGTLKWRPPENLEPTVYDRSHQLWSNYSRVFEARRMLISPGLYIGLFHLESTMQRMNILVPNERNTFIPLEKVREDAVIKPEELTWLRSFTFRRLEQTEESVGVGDLALPPPPTPSAQPDDNDGVALSKPFMRSFFRLQRQTGLRLSPNYLYLDGVVQINFGEGGSTFTVIKTEEDLRTPEPVAKDIDKQASELESRGDSTLGQVGRRARTDVQLGGPSAGESPNAAPPDSLRIPQRSDYLASDAQQLNAPHGVARILVFVCPMRTASTPRPTTLNMSRFSMYPLPLFESLCHHVYNSSVYDLFRRTMLSLQETVYMLRSELKSCLAKNGYPDIADTTLDESYRHAQQIGALPGKARRTKLAISILEEEVANLNSSWRKMNWTLKLILWVRRRHSLDLQTSFKPLTTPVTATSIKTI